MQQTPPNPKIFYSWQSDVSPARNKFKKALEIVVREIGEEIEEANRPELDSDTQGSHGSVNIMETILKKIDRCSVFVADVTPVSHIGHKLIPNPNVMAELGYALKAKTDSCLFVYSYDPKPRKLMIMPFDISGRTLIQFSTDTKPTDVAKMLLPRIKGILATQDSPTSSGWYPYIYANDMSFTAWADGVSAELKIRNSESDEYTLTAIEIEGKSAEPFRSLQANNSTSVVVNGITKIFESDTPLIKMTVTRANKIYHLEQKIQVIKGADGQNHYEKLIEQPILAHA